MFEFILVMVKYCINVFPSPFFLVTLSPFLLSPPSPFSVTPSPLFCAPEPHFLCPRTPFSCHPEPHFLVTPNPIFCAPEPPFLVTPNEVRGLPFSLSLPQGGDFSLRSKRQGDARMPCYQSVRPCRGDFSLTLEKTG